MKKSMNRTISVLISILLVSQMGAFVWAEDHELLQEPQTFEAVQEENDDNQVTNDAPLLVYNDEQPSEEELDAKEPDNHIDNDERVEEKIVSNGSASNAGDSDFATGYNWRITSDMELIIGEAGTDTYLYQYIGTDGKYEWYQYRTAIKKVSFLGSVKASDRELKNMFYYYRNLISLDLSGLDTSDATSMDYMFCYCDSLKRLDLSGLDTSKVNSMSDMFNHCCNLTSLDLSGFDTSGVTDMAWMFRDCSSLTSLDLSGFDTSKVTSMSLMFIGCSSLTSLDLSGFNTSSVTAMGDMFNGCSSLTSLDLSGFDTSKVTKLMSLFKDCSSLTSLDLSGFDTSGVTNMNSLFSGCSSLTSINLTGWDTSKVENMMDMFYGCSSLTSLDLSGFDTSSVTNMNRMLYVCDCLTDIALDKDTILTSYISLSKDNWTRYKLLDGTEVDGPSIIKLYEYTGENPGWYTTRCLNGHSFGGWNTTKEPTCTEKGLKEKVCSLCGNVVTEEIPKLGHTWNNELTVDKAVTCTSDGSESIHCSRCGEIEEGTTHIIPATGHSYSAWATTIAATEANAGQRSHRCSTCGKTETQTIAQLAPSLPSVKISKPKAAKKKITVKWKKVSKKNQKKIQGIEIQVATDPNFTNIVKATTARKNKTSKAIKGLTSKTIYYVRVRAYNNSGGLHRSAWSIVKPVKVK